MCKHLIKNHPEVCASFKNEKEQPCYKECEDLRQALLRYTGDDLERIAEIAVMTGYHEVPPMMPKIDLIDAARAGDLEGVQLVLDAAAYMGGASTRDIKARPSGRSSRL